MTQEEYALDLCNKLKDISAVVNPWWDSISIQPKIKKVIFNNPATIVYWSDNTKTVVKCQEGDTYSKEVGLAMCISKKYLGNKSNFNNEFKKWIPEEKEEVLSPEEGEKVPKEEIERMRERIERYCMNHSCPECLILSSYNECPMNHYRNFGYPDLMLEKDENIIKYYNVLKRRKA